MSILDNNHLYFLDSYGDVNLDTLKATVSFQLTEYFPSGRYGVRFLSMQDIALNYGNQYFSDDIKHEPTQFVTIENENEDTIPPQLDKARLAITATPSRPSNPNGETHVTISFYAKDNKSGVGVVSYRLRDPKGVSHHYYLYHENTHTLFFKGDPLAYKKYTASVRLPEGSAHGTWGLEEITLVDKATNQATFNFRETLHFRVAD